MVIGILSLTLPYNMYIMAITLNQTEKLNANHLSYPKTQEELPGYTFQHNPMVSCGRSTGVHRLTSKAVKVLHVLEKNLTGQKFVGSMVEPYCQMKYKGTPKLTAISQQ